VSNNPTPNPAGQDLAEASVPITSEASGPAGLGPRPAGPNDPGFTYMVTGYGETEFPEVVMARSFDEVADAYCTLVFGHPFAEVLAEAQDEADKFIEAVKAHQWNDDAVFDGWTFEVGGVKVERVYARQFGGIHAQGKTEPPRQGPSVASVLANAASHALDAWHREDDDALNAAMAELQSAMCDGQDLMTLERPGVGSGQR
jgi:hypothetical protein